MNGTEGIRRSARLLPVGRCDFRWAGGKRPDREQWEKVGVVRHSVTLSDQSLPRLPRSTVSRFSMQQRKQGAAPRCIELSISINYCELRAVNCVPITDLPREQYARTQPVRDKIRRFLETIDRRHGVRLGILVKSTSNSYYSARDSATLLHL